VIFSPAPKPQPKAKHEPKRPRAKNVQRSANAFARAYHSEERVEFVQSLPCIVPGCDQPSENAHIEGDGGSRKADYVKVAPIYSGHHRTRKDSLHALGREAFEGTHYVDLAALALDTERCFRRYAGQAHVAPPTPEGAR